MSKCARLFAMLAVISVCTGIAQADIYDDLTVHLFIQQDGNSCPHMGCQYAAWFRNDWWYSGHFQGNDPYPTSGSANFTQVAPPWTYSYTSDTPAIWLGQCGQVMG